MCDDFNDKEIVQIIRLGLNKESIVIGCLYDRFRPVIQALAIGAGIGEREVEDLLQEVIISFVDNIRLDKYQGKSSINTYLYAIAKNKCMDRVRRKKRELPYDPRELMEVDEESPETLIISTEHIEIVKTFLTLLSGRCKEAIELKLDDPGASNAELARRAGFSSAQSYASFVHKCKKSLGEKIINDPVLLGRLVDTLNYPFDLLRILSKYDTSSYFLLIAHAKGEPLSAEEKSHIEAIIAKDAELKQLILFISKFFNRR
ncbi:MAG: sigma-70 family RNA polymerase sigma factor [Bacteroidota bacterium]